MKKNLLICAGVVAFGVFACYSCKEGARRQEVFNCLQDARICSDFYNVHGGKCAECESARACRVRGIIQAGE